jgi:RNA-binding proteins (RRM domain)
MATRLYVGNLSFGTSEEELKALFQQAGTVESVVIVTDQLSGRSRGFGFVEMATQEEAVKTIEVFNGYLFEERNLIVSEAREKRGGGRWDERRREDRGGRRWD